MLKPFVSVKAPLLSMLGAVNALVHREAQTRYGRLQIGYLWAFIEPIVFISVFTMLFTLRGRTFTLLPPEIPVVMFLVSGFLPFFLFRDVYNRTMTAIRPNAQLLYFPQVHVFELCLGRVIVEVVTSFMVFTMLLMLISLFDIAIVRFDDILRMLEAALLLILMGYGGGMISGALLLVFPSIEFLTNAIILRPLLILSGVIFTVNRVPQEFREIMLYNPILHLIEMFRSAFFIEYESIYVDRPYVYIFTLVVLFLGLLMQRAFRRYALRKGL